MATNARMIRMFTSMAVGERRTLLNMAIPLSVKAKGRYFMFDPRPLFMVTNCDLEEERVSFKIANCDLEESASSFVNWNNRH